MIFFQYQFERMGYVPEAAYLVSITQDNCWLEDIRDEMLDALPSVRVALPGDSSAARADLLFLCAPNINVLPFKDIRASVRLHVCPQTRWMVMYSVSSRRWQAFPRNGLYSWAVKMSLETWMRNIARRCGRLIRIPERWL